MSIPSQVLDLENRSVGADGEATTFEAYKLLREHWDQGNHEREVALHLAFLAWYLLVEPPFLTGCQAAGLGKHELADAFDVAYEQLNPIESEDAEALYVFGLMALLAGFYLREPKVWEQRSKQFRDKYRELAPDGIAPGVFRDRGAYGSYFAEQTVVEGGY